MVQSRRVWINIVRTISIKPCYININRRGSHITGKYGCLTIHYNICRTRCHDSWSRDWKGREKYRVRLVFLGGHCWLLTVIIIDGNSACSVSKHHRALNCGQIETKPPKTCQFYNSIVVDCYVDWVEWYSRADSEKSLKQLIITSCCMCQVINTWMNSR